MRNLRWVPMLLVPIALTGCATGYAIDYVRPKTFLVAPQLARYGLDPDRAQCVGQKLGSTLSVWQLRQLADTTRAGKQGQTPGRLTEEDLVWYAGQVKDPEVPAALATALTACGGAPAALPDGDFVVTDLTELPPPGGVAGTVTEGGATSANGPADYAPSESLWAALQAYEGKDYASAARLGTIAADAGDSGAQQFLGGLYAFGQGVPKDEATAAKWYRLAAEQGWSEAMTNLGQAYESGLGVPRDAVEALKWYLLAAARPTEDPALVNANIANVSGALSIEQIDEAGRLARAWEQAHRAGR